MINKEQHTSEGTRYEMGRWWCSVQCICSFVISAHVILNMIIHNVVICSVCIHIVVVCSLQVWQCETMLCVNFLSFILCVKVGCFAQCRLPYHVSHAHKNVGQVRDHSHAINAHFSRSYLHLASFSPFTHNMEFSWGCTYVALVWYYLFRDKNPSLLVRYKSGNWMKVLLGV